jgi:ABC-type uncharacterized transport system permease subunit
MRIIACAANSLHLNWLVYVHTTSVHVEVAVVAVAVVAVASPVCDAVHSSFDTHSVRLNECKVHNSIGILSYTEHNLGALMCLLCCLFDCDSCMHNVLATPALQMQLLTLRANKGLCKNSNIVA